MSRRWEVGEFGPADPVKLAAASIAVRLHDGFDFAFTRTSTGLWALQAHKAYPTAALLPFPIAVRRLLPPRASAEVVQ